MRCSICRPDAGPGGTRRLAHVERPEGSATDNGEDGAGRDPAEVVGLPTLVFDGECGFCTASSGWIAGRRSGSGRAVPYQELDRTALEGLGLSPSQVAGAAWWVDEGGTTWAGHQAIARSLVAAGGWRGTVGRALLVPPLRWLGSAAYPLVARHRRRLPGSVPACRPPVGGGG